MKYKNFDQYSREYIPLDWMIIKNHPNNSLNGNNYFQISFNRFKEIINYLEKYLKNNSNILEIGTYPGIIPQIFYEYLRNRINYKFYGSGLNFTQEFIKKMNEYDINLINCDLDPRISDRKKNISNKINIQNEKMDFVILTDVIEHFYDPFYPLTEINRVLKTNGYLLITTDNLLRFNNYVKLLSNKSINTPLIESNIFYNGEWRPHFREYSKKELEKLLGWSGFKVIEHKFYESKFGHYLNASKKNTKKNISLNYKGKLMEIIKIIFINLFNNLKDNHIIICKKVKNYENDSENTPALTENFEEWLNLRNKFK